MEKNSNRPTRYPQNDGLNWEGIGFPVKIPQIDKFEKQNEGIAINVFGWENGGLTILRISKENKDIPRINLILITDEENSHYCWIKDMGRLVYGKTKHTTGGQQFYCDLCLSRFTNKDVLERHQEICEGVNRRPMRIEMPEPGSTIKFQNWQRQQKVPYVIYADFESIIEKLPEERSEKTEKTAQHVASGFAYTVVRSDGKRWSKKYRQGLDGQKPAAEMFLEAIMSEEEKIRKELEIQAQIKMKPQDWENFKNEKNCWICEKKFDNFKL